MQQEGAKTHENYSHTITSNSYNESKTLTKSKSNYLYWSNKQTNATQPLDCTTDSQPLKNQPERQQICG